MSSWLMSARVKMERESWVFILAYGPGSERSEEEIEKFLSELSECVGDLVGMSSGSAWGFKSQSGK